MARALAISRAEIKAEEEAETHAEAETYAEAKAHAKAVPYTEAKAHAKAVADYPERQNPSCTTEAYSKECLIFNPSTSKGYANVENKDYEAKQ